MPGAASAPSPGRACLSCPACFALLARDCERDARRAGGFIALAGAVASARIGERLPVVGGVGDGGGARAVHCSRCGTRCGEFELGAGADGGAGGGSSCGVFRFTGVLAGE